MAGINTSTITSKTGGDLTIKDDNGNETLVLKETASAVNEVAIANAATGNGPIISTQGGDTNVDLNLAPKGTGAVKSTTKVMPAGDTAAGDDAAIGYTSVEGLILTGQGSTNDVTIKNDADTAVIQIPTGGTGVTMAGTLGVTGALTANAGVVVDNITIDGTEIDLSSGDLTVDVAGDIILDAGGGDVKVAAAGTNILAITNSSSDVVFQPQVDAKDLKFNQYDGRTILEVNDAGYVAIANGATGAGELRIYEDSDNGSHYFGIKAGSMAASLDYVLPTADGSNGQQLTTDGSGNLSWTNQGASGGGSVAADDINAGDAAVTLTTSTGNITIDAAANDSDIILKGTDGGADTTFLTIDGSDAGTATFNHDIKLQSDASVIHFGANDEITLTHVHNEGLALKHTATADDKPIVLTLQTGETDIAANDVIGKIAFQAPDEGTGTDAILVAAAIQARSEGDFAADANATSIDFMVGASEAAATKVTIESTGNMNFDDGRGPVFGGGSNRPSFIGHKSNETLTLNLGGSAAMQISGNSAHLATFSGRIITDDATEATSTTDGSLQTDGGLSVAKSAVIGDDLDLLSNGAILNIGNAQKFTLTHSNANNTVVASANHRLAFGNAAEYIAGDATDLTIASSAKINLNATSDIHIPNDVGIVFGGASEKIEGDGTDLTISANNLTIDCEADLILDAGGNDFKFKAAGTEILNISNSSSDVVIKPIVDAKDIIFQQRDGTEVARVEDNGTFNVVADKLAIDGTAITATAAEVNLIDGGTSRGTTAVANGDGFLHNDGGTMRMTNVSKLADLFAGTGIDASSAVLSVAAAQTGITSLLATDIKIGEDDQTKIDFETADEIHFYAANAHEVTLAANELSPATSDGIALGTGSKMWSDLFLASGGVVNFNNGDVTLTHSSNTVTVAGGTLATAALTTSTIVASGIIKTDDTTEATSTTDGSLQTDGGLSVAKDIVGGDDLILLSDAAVIHFGADKEVTLAHDADVGLTLKHTATADNKPVILTLESAEAALTGGEVIGQINFKPGDSDGTDGAAVSAAIQAVAEATFAADNNQTSLAFMLGRSEDATGVLEKMKLSSAGELTVNSQITYSATAGGTLNLVANDGNAMDNNDQIGVIQFQGAEDGSNNLQSGAKISAVCAADWSGTENATSLKFYTMSGNASSDLTLTLASGKNATFAGRVLVDSTTDATSTTDGSLQTDGGLSVTKDIVIGDGKTIGSATTNGALTIASNGLLTAAAGITSTAAANTLGATSFNEQNITNVGIIEADRIQSDADAAGLNINFDGDTGTNLISLKDNLADALSIVEGSNDYFVVVTTNGSEAVNLGHGVSGTAITIGHTTSETTVADNLTVTGDLSVNGDTTTFTSANSQDPLVIIKNTTNDANGARLQLVKDKGAAGADDDVNGLIQFIGDDANQDQVTFAEIKSQVKNSANGQEGGKFTISVAEHDGTSTAGLVIEDGDADGELDVTLGAGTKSNTKIEGVLTQGANPGGAGAVYSFTKYFNNAADDTEQNVALVSFTNNNSNAMVKVQVAVSSDNGQKATFSERLIMMLRAQNSNCDFFQGTQSNTNASGGSLNSAGSVAIDVSNVLGSPTPASNAAQTRNITVKCDTNDNSSTDIVVHVQVFNVVGDVTVLPA